MSTIGKRRSSFGSSAFTLIEIVVVLVIMSVALTLTAVSLSGATGGVAVRESAGRLLIDLRYARYYAITHGCQCRVTFLRQNNSYTLTCRSEADQERFESLPGAGRDRLDQHVHFAAIDIQATGADGGNADAITFQPTGECDGARVEITDDRAVYTLIISPSSGLVRLHKGQSREISSDREDLDA